MHSIVAHAPNSTTSQPYSEPGTDTGLPPLSPRTQRRLIYGLLALGVFFRLFHFFNNRSFFIDELFLNVNIIKMGFRELATLPFEYEQKAPLGYLWSTRFFMALFGKQEQALRLFSLLCGLTGLFLFVPVARFFLKSWGTVLAVGMLALAYPAIYHAVEAKQYSAELLGTIVALYLYTKFKDRQSWGAMVAWGVLGGLLPWFSFPSIFVLAGIGAGVFLRAALQRDWKRAAQYLVPGALWVLSFGLVFLFFVSKYKDSGWLTYFFKIKYEGYLPLQPVAAAKWAVVKAYEFLAHPMGVLLQVDNSRTYFGLKHVLKMGWLYLPLIVAGAYFFFQRSKEYFLILFLPLAIALLASAASQYPFYQRFTLFLAPAVMLALALGAQELARRFVPSPRVAYVLLALVLLPSLANSSRQVLDPDTFYNREYYRETVFFVNDRYQEGDAVYVYWNMRQAYDYYRDAYNLKYPATRASLAKNTATSQADYLRQLQPEFAAFQGKKRLWFIYDSNNRDAIGDFVDQPAWYHEKAMPPGRLLNEHFSTLGKEVQRFRRGYYEVVLYELND
ncbi:glycosyltransferase family 39 protein [Hymenobacter arizonensis]|uniref:Dolichyl-phosphate-mannose-protein mannosyltransferase n=1 Tax=Hymenobacter arizonensis TaxID=1227077 RepID=A0A1I5Z659_HYMAR|nr:glycosyltransferase family 39 protein [Hymenobacter arizonensis]SFQ51931.1 Dolichyl-phosphate-mannose-protein mannosyltransferase [Hymenobacter arizonensis]